MTDPANLLPGATAAQPDARSSSPSTYDWPAADSPADCCRDSLRSPRPSYGAGGRKSVSGAVKRRIRQLYRTFGRYGSGGDQHGCCGELTADAAAAAAVAAAAAAAAAASPAPRSNASTAAGDSAAAAAAVSAPPATNASTCVSMNNSDPMQQQQQQQFNMSNEVKDLRGVQPMLMSAGTATSPPGDKEDDLYSVLTVDAEELRNFYSGIYIVAQCEGKKLKTKRTNRLEDIQTSFIFYRRDPRNSPIEFKMYANHLTLGRRVLIGQLSLTLQPGEPFDGMSVRRSIRERPELRTNGGSGLLFNFLSGMLHTQHLSGV